MGRTILNCTVLQQWIVHAGDNRKKRDTKIVECKTSAKILLVISLFSYYWLCIFIIIINEIILIIDVMEIMSSCQKIIK
jgi:hypothetical protein